MKDSRFITSDKDLYEEIVSCTKCPRLVAWRERVAQEKTKRFADEEYWGRPVPSFGNRNAKLLIVGLAPAAHGANRTGRMFTGDRSGDWLYEALHAYGFASQPESHHRDDDLKLIDTRITAVNHCAPPQNKLTAEEIRNCSYFLASEIQMCRQARVYLALGGIAFREALRHLPVPGETLPDFGHGATVRLKNGRLLIGSYHPSQQNTFTGRLTRAMFHDIFRTVSGELRKNS